MVRPSKRQQFAIYQDSGIPTPDSSHHPSFDDAVRAKDGFVEDDVFRNNIHRDQDGTIHERIAPDSIEDDIAAFTAPTNIDPTDTEREDARRQSAATSTSLSSLPESSFETDREPFSSRTPVHKAYSPQMIRPSFRRSVLHSKPRAGTPRSAKGSPAIKKRHEEPEIDQKEYPLVLLHVELLPIALRWSTESMQELVPEHILDNLQLLRSKVSETIAQRGILVLHPRDDYELLEERLLEALELKEERITKCGHFRARPSVSSVSSSEESTDSAMGSSVASAELCTTCHGHVSSVGQGAGTGEQKWSIKVFAANGLMRASAWSAAWSEMERVDVEIAPWIDDELRRRLDIRHQQEEAARRQRIEDDEAHIRELVEEQVRVAYEEKKRAEEAACQLSCDDIDTDFAQPEPQPHMVSHGPFAAVDDLPPIYPRKDIPLSILLRNYIYLLAQDKRNIAIFGFAALALWMSLRAALTPAAAELSGLPTVQHHSHHRTLSSDVPVFDVNGRGGQALNDMAAGDLPNLAEPSVLAMTKAEETMSVLEEDIDHDDEDDIEALEERIPSIDTRTEPSEAEMFLPEAVFGVPNASGDIQTGQKHAVNMHEVASHASASLNEATEVSRNPLHSNAVFATIGNCEA